MGDSLDPEVWGPYPSRREWLCVRLRNRWWLTHVWWRHRVLGYERPPEHDSECWWMIEPWAYCSCSAARFYERVAREGWPRRQRWWSRQS